MAPSSDVKVAIERLHTLSTSHFPTIAQSVFNAQSHLAAVPLDPKAFGSNPVGPKVMPVYEKTRTAVHGQLKATFEGLDETAGALQKIASHYRNLEEAMS